MNQYKTCSKCKQTKSAENFSPDKRSPTGLQPQCRQCVATWRAANKDRIKAQKQKYLQKPESKQKASEYSKRYREEKPEIILAIRLRYQANNKEHRRQKFREWAAQNPDRLRENKRRNYQAKPELYRSYAFNRRGRIKAVCKAISKKEFAKLYSQNCFYCGNKGGTIDHVIPLSRGGTHSIGNLVSCCKSCNSSKRDKTITEWKKWRI